MDYIVSKETFWELLCNPRVMRHYDEKSLILRGDRYYCTDPPSLEYCQQKCVEALNQLIE